MTKRHDSVYVGDLLSQPVDRTHNPDVGSEVSILKAADLARRTNRGHN